MQVNVNSMSAHANWMGNNANNIANVNSKDYNSVQTTLQNPSEGSVVASSSQSELGTDLAKELTEQIPIEQGNEAQTKAIKTEDEMLGTLLDLSV